MKAVKTKSMKAEAVAFLIVEAEAEAVNFSKLKVKAEVETAIKSPLSDTLIEPLFSRSEATL